jgi:hypothetical protein
VFVQPLRRRDSTEAGVWLGGWKLVYLYHVYGLNVRSDLLLPGLPMGGDGRDVAVRERGFRLPPAFGDVAGGPLVFSGDTAYLRCGLGSFRLHRGREVTMMLSPGAEPGFLAVLLGGTILGILLWQRHDLVLHASAVVRGGSVIAFAGQPRDGKSSLAAAMLARGYAFYADDLVPVRVVGGTHIAYPGPLALKLWPDAIRLAGGDPLAMPIAWPGQEKRLRSLGGGFVGDPLPIARLYVFDQGDAHAVTPIAAAEAVYELARCSYCAPIMRPAEMPRHFQQVVALAQAVPCLRLRRTTSLRDLPELVDVLEADLALADRPGQTTG